MLDMQHINVIFAKNTPDQATALNDISLAVKPHSFVVVIGTNGSGKTTLLNTVAGTLRSETGSITLNNRDITSWPEHRRASMIGRVFQNPFSGTAAHLTIAENLALAVNRGSFHSLRPALNADLKQEFYEQMRQLNLGVETRLDTEIGVLSGGQRQAITLLMATWRKPDLLLLDEHTAALDPRTAEQIIRLTGQMIEKKRLTVLMVTHSMQQAVNLGDRLIMMHRGKIVYDVSGEEKKRLKAENLLNRFQALRRADQLDELAAAMLKESYI